MTHDLWTTLNTKMYEYLSSVSVADLVEKQLRKSRGDVPPIKEIRQAEGGVRARSLSANV